MEKNVISVKTVAVIGIGSALMFLLMSFAAIPSGVSNTNLTFGIAVLSVFAAIFGPGTGFLIGLIGHTLTDFTAGKIWWTWVIADALYGLAIGIFWKWYKIEEGGFGVKQAVIFNLIQISANILAWVAIAPTLEILINQTSSDKVYLQGLVAGGFNIVVVLILGTLLAACYSKFRAKVGSPNAE